MPHPIILLTLDGFTPASLGCYGCSWNHTPVIDRIAAEGIVWDRCLAASDDPVANFRTWVDQFAPSGDSHNQGTMELVTDSPAVADTARQGDFQQIDLVASEPILADGDPPLDIAETQLGRLVATLLDRHARNPGWRLMWLHSQYLTERWDAPREGWSIDVALDRSEDLPMAESELDEAFHYEAISGEAASDDRPPSIFRELAPPSIELTGQEHPDFVIAWMRTYACQIQLLDLVMETILSVAADRQARIVLAGTSGFRLGQGGAIGHRPRQIRSRDIHVPMIYSAGGPIRYPRLIGYEKATAVIARLATRDDVPATLSPDESGPLVTASGRAERVMTTDDWFLVVDRDGTDHLYSKPDDIEDFNDVARVRPDVIALMESAMENPADQ